MSENPTGSDPNVRAYVRLVFRSDSMSVQEMTEIAGVAPDDSADRMSAEAGGRPRTFSRWVIASTLNPSVDVDEQLDDVFRRILAMSVSLERLAVASDSCELAIALYATPLVDPDPGVGLASEHLHLLARLNAGIDVEVFTA